MAAASVPKGRRACAGRGVGCQGARVRLVRARAEVQDLGGPPPRPPRRAPRRQREGAADVREVAADTYEVRRPAPELVVGWTRREWGVYAAMLFAAFGYTKAREQVVYMNKPEFYVDDDGDVYVTTPEGNKLQIEVNSRGDIEMTDAAGNYYYIDNRMGDSYGVDIVAPDGTMTNYRLPRGRDLKNGRSVDASGPAEGKLISQRLGNIRDLATVQTIPADGGTDMGKVTGFVANPDGIPYAYGIDNFPSLKKAAKKGKLTTVEKAWEDLFE